MCYEALWDETVLCRYLTQLGYIFESIFHTISIGVIIIPCDLMNIYLHKYTSTMHNLLTMPEIILMIFIDWLME